MMRYFVLLGLSLFLLGCAPVLHKMGLKECGPVYGNWCGEN